MFVKILLFFSLCFFTYNSTALLYAEKNKPVAKELSALSPEYPKSKTMSNIDIDIESVSAQNLLKILSLNQLQNTFKVDHLLSFGAVIARLCVIFTLFIIAWKAINHFTIRVVGSLISKTHKYKKYYDATSIANTAGPIINSILHWFVGGITLLITLSQLGVDIMPIIYSFGVFSLAISIGAQALVKDIISGILTLFDGVVAVGEIIELNGSVGTVEGMSLRSIDFRHKSGKIQVFSFSEITSLINLSRDYAVCGIVLPVSHEANLKEVKTMFEDVYASMQRDNHWAEKIKSAIDFTGVQSITETAVYVSASMRTSPDPFDLVGKEFRLRLHEEIKLRKIPTPKIASVVTQ